MDNKKEHIFLTALAVTCAAMVVFVSIVMHDVYGNITYTTLAQ